MVTPQHSRLRYRVARRRGRSRRPAGAEVIIANTFAANRAALDPAALGSRVAEANRSRVAAALRVREAAASSPVAAAGAPSEMELILERAVRRGEVDPARLSPRIRSLPVDIVRRDLIMNQQPVPDSTLVEIVDKIFLPLVTG